MIPVVRPFVPVRTLTPKVFNFHIWYIGIQWGEQVFDTLPILQVFPLTKHVEVCNFYHRYTSTVKDGIENKNPENHIV